MNTHPDTNNNPRVRVPDTAAMRRSPWRLIRATVIVLVLLTFFTAGGISIVRAGELPGLPFAIGGAIAQLTVIVFFVATLRVRATLDGDTVSRRAVTAARRTVAALRVTLWITIVGLTAYGLVRALQGDGWTLLPTLIIDVMLWLLAKGMTRLRNGLHTLANNS